MALKDRIKRNDGRYDTPLARQAIYDHLPILRKTSSITPVTNVASTRFRYNILGLYDSLGIDPKFWNTTMLINKHTSTTDVSELVGILVPNVDAVERLVKTVKHSSNQTLF